MKNKINMNNIFKTIKDINSATKSEDLIDILLVVLKNNAISKIPVLGDFFLDVNSELEMKRIHDKLHLLSSKIEDQPEKFNALKESLTQFYLNSKHDFSTVILRRASLIEIILPDEISNMDKEIFLKKLNTEILKGTGFIASCYNDTLYLNSDSSIEYDWFLDMAEELVELIEDAYDCIILSYRIF